LASLNFDSLTLADMSAVTSNPAYFLAPAGAVAALITAVLFARWVLSKPEGDDEMKRIAAAVREGAMAYLRRQYKVVAIVFVVVAGALAVLSFGMGLQPPLSVIGVPLAGFFSGLCGWFGMKIATSASARTAAAAKNSLNEGLTVAFRAGAVMGLAVVGFVLLDASVWFLLLNTFGERIGLTGDLREITTIMLSFPMGGSTQALFARVGGGIYTKAADVGADLVGKVEAGIPEDDARNPAVVADNVGDNVCDVAGMGADLHESFYGSMLATMALGAAAAYSLEGLQPGEAAKIAMLFALAPLALAGVGNLCSIIGVFVVRTNEGASFAELLQGMHRGVYAAAGLILIGAFGVLYWLLNPATDLGGALEGAGVRWWGIGLSIVSGLVAGLVIAHATEYYTSYAHAPTRRIAWQAVTGPATVIIGGIAEGMKSTWAALLTLVAAIIAAFAFAGGGENFLMGLYGVGISAVGMLATLGLTLATDAYGPIADNAGGNAEMSGQPPFVRERTDMLDSLGNTTAATGKGFSIGSAALTALALFAAYIQVVQAQITSQAESLQKTHEYAEAPPRAPHAVHQGHGRFAIVVPGAGEGAAGYVDGAMLVDPTPLEESGKEESAIAKGAVLSAETSLEAKRDAPTTARRWTLTFEDVKFEVIAARNAHLSDVLRFYDVSLTNPAVLAGLFIGTLLTFLFCALTMSAVGRAANEMMVECRRQFAKMREAMRARGMSAEQIADPLQWPKQMEHEGVCYPDYARCVSISTAGAQRQMVAPAILAITAPLAVGLVLSVPGVLGMLAGGLTSGFAVAVFMANAGGAWDNAKKLIESCGKVRAKDFLADENARAKVPLEVRDAIAAKAREAFDHGHPNRLVYGKGSEDHKATVVGDTVGDPFKDTSGPSLNILIKLISVVAMIIAPVLYRMHF
jgi:H(+)-translocating pyrophosphatase